MVSKEFLDPLLIIFMLQILVLKIFVDLKGKKKKRQGDRWGHYWLDLAVMMSAQVCTQRDRKEWIQETMGKPVLQSEQKEWGDDGREYRGGNVGDEGGEDTIG